MFGIALSGSREVSARRGDIPPFRGTRTIDDYTVEVVLAEATSTFLAAVANPYIPLSIVPEGLAEAQNGRITHPIGTGPFKFVEWEPDVHIKVARFEDYVAGSTRRPASGLGGRKVAYVDEIIFRPIPEPTARVLSLRNGEVDFAIALPPIMYGAPYPI